MQWNIGGWGNRLHAIQAADAVVGGQTPGSIEPGRWYDIRIEVRDRTVRGFIDGVLVQERTLPRVDRVLAVSGRDERTGDVILKVVNSAPEPQRMQVRFAGAPTRTRQGTVTILTSADPLDENTFEDPSKIVPRTVPLTTRGSDFTHTFPPYSLSVIRLDGR